MVKRSSIISGQLRSAQMGKVWAKVRGETTAREEVVLGYRIRNPRNE
jgi:hypothetical protein